MMVQCMGGMCKPREECPHYYAEPIKGTEPAERLCSRGDAEPQSVVERYSKDPRFAGWAARVTAKESA